MIAQVLAETAAEGDDNWLLWIENVDDLVTGIVAVVGAIGVFKLPGWVKNFSLRKTAAKTEKVMSNLEELSEKTLAEIVRAELERTWGPHDDCHQRIDTKLGHIDSQIAQIVNDMSYIKGRLKGSGQ